MSTEPGAGLLAQEQLQAHITSPWPRMSWDQLFHSGHLSLSVKVVLDFQQQCSWLNQNPAKHTPSFRSVIQWAEMSIRPAKEPGLKKKKKTNRRI